MGTLREMLQGGKMRRVASLRHEDEAGTEASAMTPVLGGQTT